MLRFALRMKTWCLSSEKQSQIVGMHKVGAKWVEIAAKLGHPKTTIYSAIERFESHEIVEGLKSIGHPQKLSEHSCKVVKCALLANQRQTFANITNQFDVDVSHWTIRKALYNSGFYNRVTVQKKPFLNDAYKCKRLEFAFEH